MRFLSVLVFFIVASAASADQGHDNSQSMQQGHDMTHGATTHDMAGMDSESCDLGIHLSEAAERRPGGALYAKATAHGHSGQSHDQQMGAASDSKVLEAALGPDLTRPFEAELYVRFPESDEPELFNVLISK
jgi:hypothetical protein